MDQTWTFLQGSNDRSIFRHFYGDSSRDKESFSNRSRTNTRFVLLPFSITRRNGKKVQCSAALPWKANVRLENFVYQLNHWAHWLNRFHRLTKICAPTRIIRDHPVPFKSKCHDDKTFTAMIGEPHIMGASLFQFVIIF